MLKFMIITNQPADARAAVDSGVQRIMVDLEILGKYERQGHKDTFVTTHVPDDIDRVRRAVPDAELMVRVNPYHAGTPKEVDDAIARGADLMMLPMFTTLEEVQRTRDAIGGRARFVPLCEHRDAFNALPAIAEQKLADELYLGLNDLHLSLGQHFVFAPLLDGYGDRFAAIARAAGLPFGIGGVGVANAEPLRGDWIMAEYARIGSTRVILGRAFQKACTGGSRTLAESAEEMQTQIEMLHDVYARAHQTDAAQQEEARQRLYRRIEGLVTPAK
ncbi:MAG: aldolase/citrate lyase family protein [bacterium]|jgi:hypothetical protein